MNLRKYASNKVIAIVTAIMLVISGFITQHYKIKKLQDELYIQQNMTEQRYNYTATSADIKTLEEELNSLCEYKILDGTVNIKHTYAYQKDSILGLKKKYKLVGTADFYYELVVNFKDVKIISFTDDEIVLEIDYPVVNEDACHRVPNTFIRFDDECDESLLSNKEDAETATRVPAPASQGKSKEKIRARAAVKQNRGFSFLYRQQAQEIFAYYKAKKSRKSQILCFV